MLIWDLQSSQCSKIRVAQHWGRRGVHLIENKGVKSECMKFGENSRQMPSVSTICDEYCGSLGYGAFLRGLWFTGLWSPLQAQQSIAYKELFPLVVAAHIWGDMWCRRHILFHSDNDAVVHILNSRTSKIPLHYAFIAPSSIVSC